MKAIEIKKVLEDHLVGKEFGYCWSSDVAKIVRELFQDKLMDITIMDKNQTVEVKYKGHYWIRIEAKKQKGKYHHSYFGGSYDWTFKGFGVYVYDYHNCMDEDTNESIGSILTLVEQENAKKADDLGQAAKAMKLVMQEFGCDKYKARDIMKKACDSYYIAAFEELLEK